MTEKFDYLDRLRSGHTEGIVTPENNPYSFGTFEKRAPAPQLAGQFISGGGVVQLLGHWVCMRMTRVQIPF